MGNRSLAPWQTQKEHSANSAFSLNFQSGIPPRDAFRAPTYSPGRWNWAHLTERTVEAPGRWRPTPGKRQGFETPGPEGC